MVFDRLATAAQYVGMDEGIAAALRFLLSADLDALAPGRHDVLPPRVFALVSDYDTRPVDDVPWEAHQQHLDVHYVHRGEERIAVACLDDLAAGPYDADRDVVPADGAVALFLPLRVGTFAMFGPHDAHKPGVVVHVPSPVRKVVVKVRIPA